MADVRALLRQQRAARRVEHPHASYSDAGKLVCTVCNEQVKTESLWDGHLRGAGHRQRLQRIHQSSTKNGSNGYAGFVDQGSEATGPTNKRKLADSDEDMADADADDTISRRKRTKPDGSPTEHSQQETRTPAKKDDGSKPTTPPFTRRTSGTPTAGVEMQIPSRPATPGPGGTGTPKATTPRAVPVGRSPLIPDEATTSQQESIRGTRTGGGAQPTVTTTTTTTTTAAPAVPVDEDEWAAFEADLVHGPTTTQTNPAHNSNNKPTVAALAALDSDAVISAPVMSAAEIAAKSEEEERAKRRALVDIQIEDEKEEATRALENEFEVMEELEARAKKLRERREALRVQSNGNGNGNGGGGGGSAPVVAAGAEGKGGSVAAAVGKENAVVEEEEEEDDEDEDDWDGFRFRA